MKLYIKTANSYRLADAQTVCDTATDYALDALKRQSDPLTSPNAMRDFLRVHYATAEREIFSIFLLDNQHQLIAVETPFAGTIDSATIHPRELVKLALTHNASAMILAHNHPSGNPEPSQADQRITRRITDALALVDVRVLDHFIVGTEIISFAEKGLI